MTLRSRMGAVAGLAVAVTVIAVALTVYLAVRAELIGQIDTALNDRAKPFLDAGRGPGPGGGAPRGDEPDRARGVPPPRDPGGGLGEAAASSRAPFGGPSGHVQFVRPDGRVVKPPDETSKLPAGAGAKAIAASGRGRDLRDAHVKSVHLRVLTVGLGSRGALQVARPLDEVDGVLRKLLIVLVLVGLAGIAVAAVLGGVVARTALAPIARFTRRTERLTGDPDLSQRLEVEGRDELARLARSFNATLDALERSMDAQRHLVADASHELRTPIASLRANIQTLEDADRLSAADLASLRADVVDELDELTALVGDVVELARDGESAQAPDDVRLDEIAAAQIERAHRRAGQLSFQVSLEPTVVSGQPDRINRAVSNVIDNACKWSPPGATIDVELHDAVLSVRDRGPGFHTADLPHVFDRFYRAQEARGMPGSGLGLAIVRQAAESHGGFAVAENASGGGALVRLSFGPQVGAPASSAG